ncbi:penicillin-binding transpeptidase domain-containing protein [Streptomyces sp. NPDC001292]|uniref:penicillin-binding transpeptidase domain-containing protein n=1 Tax=Streptomyces sp. NPDC001292 TaxID=3364558 RepID=UPI00367C1B7E
MRNATELTRRHHELERVRGTAPGRRVRGTPPQGSRAPTEERHHPPARAEDPQGGLGAGPSSQTGIVVGGKTGTAQRGVNVADEVPYGWFVSCGKKPDGASVAVAVFIGPTDMDIYRQDISGGRLGAPIARSVMKAVLQQ